MEDGVTDGTQDHVEFGGDAEFESETEAIVGALGPIEESDAIEVFATWKQTRTATTREAQSRAQGRLYANTRAVRPSPKTF